MRERISFLCDPLLDLHGPGRVVSLLSQEFARHYDVTVVTPAIDPGVRATLESSGIPVVDLGRHLFCRSSSMAFAEAWLRETVWGGNGAAWGRSGYTGAHVINFSQTIAAPASIWYLLGSVSQAIADIGPTLPGYQRLGVRALHPMTRLLDTHLIETVTSTAPYVVAASGYSGQTYQPWDLRVDAVLYPPLDTEIYHPVSHFPEEGYCLAYLGKEVDTRAILRVADAGIPILLFGSKVTTLPNALRNHRGIEVLKFVSETELAELYSHARFTLFPFTTEPFGYVPVESMACGTPVLTYARHGPAETVVDGRTGWLCNGPDDFAARAVALWDQGSIPISMRTACVERAQRFSLKTVAQQWLSLLAWKIDGHAAPVPRIPSMFPSGEFEPMPLPPAQSIRG
ncbi:MAG: glycosyltransferase [Thermoplasmata archaeon]|nr:glycosyltransferase [Thermoplasmata archaeon]